MHKLQISENAGLPWEKLQIWALNSQFVDYLCAFLHTIRCGHLYLDWTMALCEAFDVWHKTHPFHKEYHEQGAKTKQDKGMKSFLLEPFQQMLCLAADMLYNVLVETKRQFVITTN